MHVHFTRVGVCENSIKNEAFIFLPIMDDGVPFHIRDFKWHCTIYMLKSNYIKNVSFYAYFIIQYAYKLAYLGEPIGDLNRSSSRLPVHLVVGCEQCNYRYDLELINSFTSMYFAYWNLIHYSFLIYINSLPYLLTRVW